MSGGDFYDINVDDQLDNEDIKTLMFDYEIDRDEAEEMMEIMDEYGLNEDDALKLLDEL